MASPSTVLSRGYGSWGSVNLVITRGLGVGVTTEAVPDPYRPRSFHRTDDRLRSPTPSEDRLRASATSDDRLRKPTQPTL
jgi:hypothetical protein